MPFSTTRFEAAGLRCIEVVSTATPEPEGGRPLVVGLHGLGDKGDSYVNIAELLSPDYRYVFPTGPQPVRYGMAVVGYAWFDIYRHDLRAAIAESRPVIDQLFTALQKKYNTPPNRTVMLGFSQGAMVTLDYGLRRLDGVRFAGLAALSGFLPEAVVAYFGMTGMHIEAAPASALIESVLNDAAKANQQVLITHGRRDGIVPILSARETRTLLEKHGLHPQYYEFDAGHEITPDMLGVIRTYLAHVLK